MKIVAPNNAGIAVAVEALRRGDVVCYPTETVYGLGVDPLNEGALRRLFDVKERDSANPVLLIIGEMGHLTPIAAPMSALAAKYARAFWPGPLSLLLKPAPGLPEPLLGEGGYVCVRWTASATAQALCRAFGGAIVSTSANRSGKPAARSLGEITLSGVAVGIDGGTLEESAASTVFDPETGVVLREGAVASDLLYRLRA